MLNPRHGFAISKDRDLYHQTLHHRMILTRVAKVKKGWKFYPQTLGRRLRVTCLMITRGQSSHNHPTAPGEGRLPRSSPQMIQR